MNASSPTLGFGSLYLHASPIIMYPVLGVIPNRYYPMATPRGVIPEPNLHFVCLELYLTLTR